MSNRPLKYRRMTPQQICDQINASLDRFFDDAAPDATVAVVSVARLDYRYPRVPLMRCMGLIETVRRGGGPDGQVKHPLHQTPITGTVYRITRRHIELEGLLPFLGNNSKQTP